MEGEHVVIGEDEDDMHALGLTEPADDDVDLEDDASERPVWVPDEDAVCCAADSCHAPFGFLKRRHHCRGCGNVFCNDCCNQWLVMPERFKYSDPQRLCRSCFRELSLIDHSRNYDEHGDPKNPTLVLLHGMTATRGSFATMVRDLKAQFHLLVPDLPGHGTREKEEISMAAAAQCVVDLVKERTESGRAYYYGYSYGGYVAMVVAGTHSSNCLGIIASGAASDYSDMRLSTAALGMLYHVLPERFKAGRFRTAAPGEIDREVIDECFLKCGCYFESWRPTTKAIGGEDYTAHLGNFFGSTLFINGSLDLRDAEEKWLEAAHDSKLVVLENGDMLVHVDRRHRERVVKAVVEFVERCEEMRSSRSSFGRVPTVHPRADDSDQ